MFISLCFLKASMALASAHAVHRPESPASSDWLFLAKEKRRSSGRTLQTISVSTCASLPSEQTEFRANRINNLNLIAPNKTLINKEPVAIAHPIRHRLYKRVEQNTSTQTKQMLLTITYDNKLIRATNGSLASHGGRDSSLAC